MGEAMRGLGRLYFARGEEASKRGEGEGGKEGGKEGWYAQACKAYEASVALNVLQSDTWFALGCCALRAALIPLAAAAFRRKVDLDPDVRNHIYYHWSHHHTYTHTHHLA